MKNELIDIKKVISENSKPYMVEVVINRALPFIDAMKPSHRKLLYTMYKMGLLDGNRTKSANIVGQTMKLNPHGDCLKGNTKVFLADGRITTLEELYTKKELSFDVLAYDEITNNVKITRAHSLRIGKTTNLIYNIELYNGDNIKCSSNHPFLDSSGNWIKAENLTPNKLLNGLVLNFDKNASFRPNIKGLHQKQLEIHRLVEHNEDLIHHIDEDINNNSLKNLIPMSRSSHALLHGDYFVGLNNGLKTMFGNESNSLKIKNKNKKLRSAINTHMSYYRFKNVIKYMKEKGIAITQKSYTNIGRVKSGIYRPPHIDSILNKYKVEFNELIKLVDEDWSPVKDLGIQCETLEKKTTPLKITSSNADDIFKYNSKKHNIFKVFKYMIENEIEINIHGYEIARLKLISKNGLGYGNISGRSFWRIDESDFNYFFEIFLSENPVVKSITTILEDKPVPLYDFTVDGYENMYIVTGEISKNKYQLLCTHNSAIYSTMVRMTKDNDTLTIPYIDSKGNFGKVYSREMQCAASRYTECKLSEISKMLFQDINKNTVDFVDNYDGTIKEPSLLPVVFPTILCNPNLGVAVGMASNILPFNMVEINKGVIHYLKTNKTTMLKKANVDFSTGAQLLFDKNEHNKIMETGKGKIKIRAKYEIDKKNRKILIKEIPYSTTTEAIEDSIVELIKSKKIKEISNIYDETDLKGLQIGIEYIKNANPEQLINKLFKLTPLQTSITTNMNIITLSGRPKVMGVLEIVDEWLKFRKDCILRGLNYDLIKHKSKLHELNGLNKILLDIDKTIDIIKKSDNDENTKTKLMQYFKIDEVQAKIVMDIKLKDLNKSYIKNKVNEITNLESLIKEIEYKINTPKEIDNIIINQLTEVNKKYGVKRKTEVLYEYDTVKDIRVIEEYSAKVYLTKQGYLKKTKDNATGNFKIKEDDEIVKIIDTNNKSDLFILTSLGIAHRIPLEKIQLVGLNSLGEYIPNLIKLKKDEQFLDIFIINNYEKENINTVYYDKIKKVVKIHKVSAKSYKSIQNKSKFSNCLSQKFDFIDTNCNTEDINVLTMSKDGRVNIFNTKNINVKQSRKGDGNTITKGIDLFKVIIVKEGSIIEIKTKKGKIINIKLSDNYDKNRTYFSYLFSKTARKGNYIINDRRDEIVELKIIE